MISLPFSSLGQITVMPADLPQAIISGSDSPNRQSRSTSETCTDIVTYPQAKNSGSFQGLIVNPNSSAASLGQWYDAPQPVIISGFDLFAWQDDPLSNQPVTVACNLYKAGSNYFPVGAPLASATVTIDTNFGNGNLQTDLKYTATFPSPVAVNFPYILMVESSSSISIAMITNDWHTGSGDLENLAIAKLGSTWYRGLSITVGSVTFDSDVLVHPYVSYDLLTDFSKDKTCINTGDTVHFQNQCSPIYKSRFYNRFVFNDPANSPDMSYEWDFGDGSAKMNAENIQHAYSPKGKYIIHLQTLMNAWSHNCESEIIDSVDQVPVADFEWGNFNLVKNFFNTSQGVDHVLWDFGDGNSTTQLNPVYSFNDFGSHQVRLIVYNACSNDTISKEVMAYPTGFSNLTDQNQVDIYPVPADDYLTLNIPEEFLQNARVIVYDLSGKMWINKNIIACQQCNRLDTKSLASGMYQITLSNKIKTCSKLFTITR